MNSVYETYTILHFIILNFTRIEEKGNAFRILVGKQEGKRPLGRPRK
jgi:hypothetical protein